MSKVSHLPKRLPSKDLPFSVKIKGSTTRHQYTGDFVVRVPSVRDQGRIGVEFARLSEGVPLESLDVNTATLHNAIAFLRVALISGPRWFMNPASDPDEEGMDYGLDTDDFNVPIQIFKAATKEVRRWNEALQGQPEEATAPEASE